jgi:hypothetical protein
MSVQLRIESACYRYAKTPRTEFKKLITVCNAVHIWTKRKVFFVIVNIAENQSSQLKLRTYLLYEMPPTFD